MRIRGIGIPESKYSFHENTVHPVSHIGDEPRDRGHGVRLFECSANDLHHPIVILRVPVIARLELLDGHVLRPYDLEFPTELGPMQYPGDTIDIVRDFSPQRRKVFNAANWSIPECNIWMDSLKPWWSKQTQPL